MGDKVKDLSYFLSHMHIAHTMLNKNGIDESQPFACPIASCNMPCRREGWLSRHIAQCHQASEEASTPSPTPTTPATKKTRMPTITSEFKCPLCIKILPTKKGMTLHCYLKHRFSVLQGMFMNKTTVGMTTRSSESRRQWASVNEGLS